MRHDDENTLDSLNKQLLTLSGKAPMHILKKFLARKLSYSNSEKGEASWQDIGVSSDIQFR
jgi:hypothetical protein